MCQEEASPGASPLLIGDTQSLIKKIDTIVEWIKNLYNMLQIVS